MNKQSPAAAVGAAAVQPGAGAQESAPDPGLEIIHPGDRPSKAGAHSTFTGRVRYDSISRAGALSPYSVSAVTFEPGARTFWHTHPPDSAS